MLLLAIALWQGPAAWPIDTGMAYGMAELALECLALWGLVITEWIQAGRRDD